ncbi:hypothetical protein ABZ322_18495, partial [Streptomyces sp. NPDC006129]
MTVTAFSPRREPNEVARVTSTAAELLEVLLGQASTAPVSGSQLRVLLILESPPTRRPSASTAAPPGAVSPRPAWSWTAARC